MQVACGRVNSQEKGTQNRRKVAGGPYPNQTVDLWRLQVPFPIHDNDSRCGKKKSELEKLI
jgi:hypothetical protein